MDPSYHPAYDGLNVYGEIAQTFNMTDVFRAVVLPALVGQGLLSSAGAAQVNAIFGTYAPNYFGTQTIRSTGYKETDLHDGNTSSFKVDLAGHSELMEIKS